MSNPTVKLHPDFKAGEFVFCASTREKFKVLEVTKEGLLCEGRAGIMPLSVALKELPKED